MSEVIVPAELECFRGHFEGAPVLPAIAQLDLIVVPQVRREFAELRDLVRMTKLKFLAPIAPDDRVKLELTRKDMRVNFVLSRNGEVCTRGTLHFGDFT